MLDALSEIDAKIKETKEWRLFHKAQYLRGARGAQIEAAACAVREEALREARNIVEKFTRVP